MINFRRIRKTGGSTYIVTLPKKWADFHNIKPNQNLACLLQKDGNLLVNPYQSPEFRRVQKTGGSSLILSLPKDWIKANNLKERQEIALIPQDNGMLVLNSHIQLEKEKMVKKIEVNHKTKPDFLLRLLIGSYVMGFAMVDISSDQEIPSQCRDTIIEFTRMIIGMENVGETMQTINLQETTDIDDKLFEKGIKRMEILVKSMQKDIIEAIESNNPDLLNRVISRDEEINKLHRLVRRQMNRILLNANIPRYSKISISTLKQNFLISQNIERIGDQTVNIALLIKKYFTSTKNSKIISIIKEMSSVIISVLEQCVLSWKSQNIKLANDSMDRIQKFTAIYDSVSNVSNGVFQKEDHLLLYLLREEFKKSFFLALNIAEIVIDVIVLKT